MITLPGALIIVSATCVHANALVGIIEIAIGIEIEKRWDLETKRGMVTDQRQIGGMGLRKGRQFDFDFDPDFDETKFQNQGRNQRPAPYGAAHMAETVIKALPGINPELVWINYPMTLDPSKGGLSPKTLMVAGQMVCTTESPRWFAR